MAATATQRQGGRPARAGAAKKPRPKAAASKALVKHAVTPGGSSIAGKLARKGAAVIGRRALRSGADALRTAASRSAEFSRNAIEGGVARRAPIQVSVDVAVPLKIAWQEWMAFNAFTEGVNRIEDVRRDGDCLVGRTAAPRSAEWVADIVDERDQESFAWRSVGGSDCAGLITFHRLSDRLTRIELDLDVLPTRPADAVSLGFRIADRRAETDLRRFKADVEFINPDVYADKLTENGDRSNNRRKRPRRD